MRKSLLAVAALMGASVLPAKAAMIRVDEQTFSTLDLTLRITAQQLGKARSDAKDWTDFAIRRATFNMSGQVNKMVKFEFEGDFSSATTRRGVHGGGVTINDAVITLDFKDEFKVRAGRYRVPFARANLTSSRNYIIPTGIRWGFGGTGATQDGYRAPDWNPFAPATLAGDRDAGISVWGNIADGMVQYRLGVFDGRFDHTNRDLGVKDHLAYGIRFEFNPTMLGYKAEKGWGKSDSHLGRQNVLNMGIAYWAQKYEGTVGGRNVSGTAKAFAIDAMWEQKFGDLVPNVQLGYINQSDLPSNLGFRGKKPETNAFYVQGQLLHNQVVAFGRPALALRYEYSEYKDFTYGNPTIDGKKGKVSRTSIFFNHYMKGWNAVTSFGADIVTPNGVLKRYNNNQGKNFTDWTLAMQVIF